MLVFGVRYPQEDVYEPGSNVGVGAADFRVHR
jgi:hypothetical protein